MSSGRSTFSLAANALLHQPTATRRALIVRASLPDLALGPWDEKYLIVEGEKLSLNDIEYRILRQP